MHARCLAGVCTAPVYLFSWLFRLLRGHLHSWHITAPNPSPPVISVTLSAFLSPFLFFYLDILCHPILRKFDFFFFKKKVTRWTCSPMSSWQTVKALERWLIRRSESVSRRVRYAMTTIRWMGFGLYFRNINIFRLNKEIITDLFKEKGQTGETCRTLGMNAGRRCSRLLPRKTTSRLWVEISFKKKK